MPDATKERCVATRTGDFNYKACASFCKAERGAQHCEYCKCLKCDFCSAASTARDVAPPPSTKKPSTKKATTLPTAAPPPSIKKPSTKKATALPTKAGEASSTSGGHVAATASATAEKPASKRSVSKQPKTSAASSGDLGSDVPALQAALKAADARARSAEARLSAMEKQLSLCRHSSLQLRNSAGKHATDLAAGASFAVGGAGGGIGIEVHGTSVSWRSNATSARAACDEAIDHALAQLVAITPRADTWSTGVGERYPGLNATSARGDVQRWLHSHDRAASRCADPRTSALLSARRDDAAGEAIASLLLLVAVLLCAMLNAWSLGYLQPNRHVRRCLATLGCKMEAPVR